MAQCLEGASRFRYTHARTHTTRSLAVPVDDFLTRFLHHVLPRGFTKVRWYGLLSAGRRAELERARTLLGGDAGASTRRRCQGQM